MSATKRPDEANTTFASRRAEREAAAAAGQTPPPRRERGSLRAGVNEPQPVMTVTRARA